MSGGPNSKSRNRVSSMRRSSCAESRNEPANLRLAQGLYATTINVHNPNQQTAVFKKKLALSFPPAEQRPGKVLPISQDTLREDEALAVDCIDIQKRLFPNGFPTPYIEGFIVIRSTVSLDVTAVYSTGVAGKDECCRASKTNPSIDVVQIRERIIAQAPRQPDLVPVNPQPNAGRLGFCRRDPSSGRLVVTVRNQGVGPAGPSHTNVNFTTGTTVTSVTVNTPTISGRHHCRCHGGHTGGLLHPRLRVPDRCRFRQRSRRVE